MTVLALPGLLGVVGIRVKWDERCLPVEFGFVLGHGGGERDGALRTMVVRVELFSRGLGCRHVSVRGLILSLCVLTEKGGLRVWSEGESVEWNLKG